MRSPPWPSCGAFQKCCCPVPKSVPTEAKLAMWPPSSSSLLFARGNVRAGAARLVDQPLKQVMRALGALALEHGFERIEPLLRL
jgi:hypothetical protein